MDKLNLFLIIVIINSISCDIGVNFLNHLIENHQNEAGPCEGIFKNQGESRVVGGETSPVNYAYQVSLQMYSNSGPGLFFFQQKKSNYSHFCAGSIVNPLAIVTAAHCVQGFDISQMSVFAGENDLREESKGQRRSVASCKIHPDYVELSTSDIAVCKLKTPLQFNSNVQPIAFNVSTVPGGVGCTLSGWGYTSMIR